MFSVLNRFVFLNPTHFLGYRRHEKHVGYYQPFAIWANRLCLGIVLIDYFQ